MGPASRLSPHDHHWPKRSLFLINESTSKFIEINGNPSSFYVIDCYRRHYHTQINKIIKITHKICIFVAPRQPLKICVSRSLDQIHQTICIHLIKNIVDESRQHSVMQTHRFHHFSRKSISMVAQCQLRASHVSARFFEVYLLNTLSTSHDIDGIENSSNAIRANVEYIISFAFHHAMRSNVQFASRPTKVSFESFKYRSNSSCTSSSAPN